MANHASDEAELTALIQAFFAGFTSGGGADQFERLRALFIPDAVIVKTCGEPVSYDVDGFVAPREKILTDGTLTEFHEWPEDGRLEIFGDIAHWFGSYRKSGRQDGVEFTGAGMKSIQFVRAAGGWRISAAAWDDERAGGSQHSTWPSEHSVT